LALGLAGCTTKPMPRAPVVDRVDVAGAEEVDGDEVEHKIATRETERLLGGAFEPVPLLRVIDALTVDYQFLDRFVLQRDLDRVQRYYRSRGFYDVQVRAGRIIELEDGSVRVEIVVREGLPVLIESVELDFPDWQQAFETNAKLHDIAAGFEREPVVGGEAAPRFDEERYEKTKRALIRALTDDGFAHAELVGKVAVDLARRRAKVRFEIAAGPPCTFGPVLISGVDEAGIPESLIRRALGFEEGEPFSTESLALAERALGDFGVFGSVEITPELVDSPETADAAPSRRKNTAIPIRVRLRPVKLRAVKLGVGTEIGTLVDVHGIAGWEDRNFIGGLRRFSVEIHPGLDFFPTSSETLFSVPATHVLPKAKLQLDFKQPGFPEARTNMLLSWHGHINPSRNNPVPDPVPDDFNILGYRGMEGSFGFNRKFHFAFWEGSTLYLGQFIKLQISDPFSYNLPEPDLGLETVTIPYLETAAWWDFRRGESGELDPVHPRKGVFFGTNLQFAGGFLQGDADDVRVRPELRAYAPVSPRLTMAVRGAVGFLFPRNYGETLELTASPGALPDDVRATLARDLQILSFRALFSGGANSNRGYGYREVGPYYNFAALSDDPAVASDPLLAQWRATGGRAQWELSAELRIALTEQIGTVLFVDASDVTRTINDMRVDHPHISPGVGARVATPVGPLRVDLGVRVPYLQQLGEKVLPPEEGGPISGDPDSFPVALNIAIGEAY
jgi:outer membrane protein insertion porin family/translocation and assembly module TamA